MKNEMIVPIAGFATGGLIALGVLFANPSKDIAFAALGVAATAIGGAAGVANQRSGTSIDIERSENTPIVPIEGMPPELPVEDQPRSDRPVGLPPIRPFDERNQ